MSKDTEVIVVEVSQEEYETELACGLREDEVLPPGRHIFRRGAFLARHGIDPNQSNVTIEIGVTVNLDPDIYAYFRKQAALPNAESMQIQINKVLRRYIDTERLPTHQ